MGLSALPAALEKPAKVGAQLVCVEVAGQSSAALIATMSSWGGLVVADGGSAEFRAYLYTSNLLHNLISLGSLLTNIWLVIAVFPSYQDQGGRLN